MLYLKFLFLVQEYDINKREIDSKETKQLEFYGRVEKGYMLDDICQIWGGSLGKEIISNILDIEEHHEGMKYLIKLNS